MSEFRKTKQTRRVKAQSQMFFDPSSLDSGLDFQDFPEGRSGFTKAKQIIKQMVAQGYEDIDIIIKLHEEMPKDVAETALIECKERGIL